MSRTGSIARTMHAGGAVQGIDFQTGIIGKTIHAIALIDPPGLLPCITFERVGILGDVVMAAYVIDKRQSMDKALSEVKKGAITIDNARDTAVTVLRQDLPRQTIEAAF